MLYKAVSRTLSKIGSGQDLMAIMENGINFLICEVEIMIVIIRIKLTHEIINLR